MIRAALCCAVTASLAACAQAPEQAFDAPCDNTPLNSLRHLLDGDYEGVRMVDIPLEVLASERELLIGIAGQNADAEKRESFTAHWQEQIPDPRIDMAFYESIDMRECSFEQSP